MRNSRLKAPLTYVWNNILFSKSGRIGRKTYLLNLFVLQSAIVFLSFFGAIFTEFYVSCVFISYVLAFLALLSTKRRWFDICESHYISVVMTLLMFTFTAIKNFWLVWKRKNEMYEGFLGDVPTWFDPFNKFGSIIFALVLLFLLLKKGSTTQGNVSDSQDEASVEAQD